MTFLTDDNDRTSVPLVATLSNGVPATPQGLAEAFAKAGGEVAALRGVADSVGLNKPALEMTPQDLTVLWNAAFPDDKRPNHVDLLTVDALQGKLQAPPHPRRHVPALDWRLGYQSNGVPNEAEGLVEVSAERGVDADQLLEVADALGIDVDTGRLTGDELTAIWNGAFPTDQRPAYEERKPRNGCEGCESHWERLFALNTATVAGLSGKYRTALKQTLRAALPELSPGQIGTLIDTWRIGGKRCGGRVDTELRTALDAVVFGSPCSMHHTVARLAQAEGWYGWGGDIEVKVQSPDGWAVYWGASHPEVVQAYTMPLPTERGGQVGTPQQFAVEVGEGRDPVRVFKALKQARLDAIAHLA
jgi:hypothetical protein